MHNCLMKCLIIFGPAAVGKMTVGKAIAAKTGYKLFHNHMSIDLLLNFFEYGEPAFRRLDNLIRFSVMEEFAKSDQLGFIFTFLWTFTKNGQPTDDADYIQKIVDIFTAQGAETVFLELECGLEERLRRNTTELRLKHKPSKRDTKFSEKNVRSNEKLYRMNSIEGELEGRKHLKINNEKISPQEVAERAIVELGL